MTVKEEMFSCADVDREIERLTDEIKLLYQGALMKAHRDGFSRFSVRSAWRGDTVYRKTHATTSESLEKPPFRSPPRAAGGRRETLPMHRIACGSAPTRRGAEAISMGLHQRSLVLEQQVVSLHQAAHPGDHEMRFRRDHALGHQIIDFDDRALALAGGRDRLV